MYSAVFQACSIDIGAVLPLQHFFYVLELMHQSAGLINIQVGVGVKSFEGGGCAKKICPRKELEHFAGGIKTGAENQLVEPLKPF